MTISLQRVSGALRKAGVRAAKWNPSGMVRGWGDWSPGVRTQREHDGAIEVYFVYQRYANASDERRAGDLAMAEAALSAAGIEFTRGNGRLLIGGKE